MNKIMKIEYTAEQTALFKKLIPFMLEYNKNVNLTRITDEKEIWEKHFTDSLLPLLMIDIPKDSKVIDIGTGAGFPGVPWKIYRGDLDITLLDSLQKRILYLERLNKYLNIEYKAIHGRSEELSHDKKYREYFDISVSRAVANLPALVEYCLPFVKCGGYFYAMKGAKNEVNESKNAIQLLGGELKDVIEYELENGDKRNLIIIKKISHTPPIYPRRTINITKKPL